ncbi:TraR/DksA family transcriptional regulator [Streptomyces sp. SYSU K217416]
MVAKKTAVQKKTASAGSTGAAAGEAKQANGKTTAVADKATAGKTVAVKKATVNKTQAKKAAAKPVKPVKPAKKARVDTAHVDDAQVKKTPDKQSPATKTPTKKAPARKAPAKAAAKKAAPAAATAKATAKKAATAAKGAAQAADQTGAKTVVAKKTPAGTAARKHAAEAASALPKARTAAPAEPGELAVRPGEDPWTPEEVADARAELEGEVLRLRTEIVQSEEAVTGLMRDSGDGAGHDEADTGTKNITREHELALAANAREMLEQTERAVERLDAGTYGLCENCGNPIGKARMLAFPRATLCVECKQKQERRS